MSGNKMTGEAASRIQAAEAKAGGGGVDKGSFAARAQGAAARNEAAGGAGKAGSSTAGMYSFMAT